jgi:hypothetical protein
MTEVRGHNGVMGGVEDKGDDTAAWTQYQVVPGEVEREDPLFPFQPDTLHVKVEGPGLISLIHQPLDIPCATLTVRGNGGGVVEETMA